MKICHVITRMIVGGAQENTLYTVLGHVAHGHETVLVTGPSMGPEGELLKKRMIPAELRIVTEPNLVRAISPRSDLAAYRSLCQLFESENFDVVHTHSSKAGVLGRLAANRAGVPVIVHTIHGQAFHAYQSWWRNRLYIACERVAARHCHRIFSVAGAMIDQCVASKVAARDKYRTVYSGMELEPFAETPADPDLRHRLGLRDDAFVIGKIARLFELKGYEYLLPAAIKIVEDEPNVQFLVVGDGNMRERFEKNVRDAGLANHFVFTGLVPPADIPRYTALMDVLVHLSLREGLPRSVVQAHAAGKPAIGFDLDGTPEIILDGKTGIVCPPQDVGAVSAAAIALIHDPDGRRRMGAAGREHAFARWDWRQMVDVIEREYTELAQQSRLSESLQNKDSA
jgi:glycosyltransferase involved in cell wall biosynthesis